MEIFGVGRYEMSHPPGGNDADLLSFGFEFPGKAIDHPVNHTAESDQNARPDSLHGIPANDMLRSFFNIHPGKFRRTVGQSVQGYADTGQDGAAEVFLVDVDAVKGYGGAEINHDERRRELAAGGTGQTFDWSIISRLGLRKPYMLAGGLDPENITAALQAVRPYGVDVNSGLEVAPGIKDHRLIKEFVRTVREFDDRDISGQI